MVDNKNDNIDSSKMIASDSQEKDNKENSDEKVDVKSGLESSVTEQLQTVHSKENESVSNDSSQSQIENEVNEVYDLDSLESIPESVAKTFNPVPEKPPIKEKPKLDLIRNGFKPSLKDCVNDPIVTLVAEKNEETKQSSTIVTNFQSSIEETAIEKPLQENKLFELVENVELQKQYVDLNPEMPKKQKQPLEKCTDEPILLVLPPVNSILKSELNTCSNISNFSFDKSDLAIVELPHRKYETLPLFERKHEDQNKCSSFYRQLSFRIPFTSLGNIPSADSHKNYDKAGYLLKLCGRGFPYLHQWRRRYCVLSKGCLYVHENEKSKRDDKNSCIIDLKYFDHVAQALQKETKKASNVFLVTSQDKTFFDHGRHLFSADTLTEMHEWMGRLTDSIEQIRNNNRPSPVIKSDRRQSREAPQIQGQVTQNTDVINPYPLNPEDVTDGNQNPKEENYKNAVETKVSHRLSKDVSSEILVVVEKEDPYQEPLLKTKISSQKVFLKAPEQSESKPLESITKNRVKGPAGRRAPQNRKPMSMKQRASSMSALHPDNNLEDGGRANFLRFNPSDLLSEEISSLDVGPSQSVSAYHYSSDEDSPAISPPSSNFVREIRPVDGLGVLHNPQSNFRTSRGSPPLPEYNINQDLLEYRSLPKNLRKKVQPSHIKGDTLLMKLPTYETNSSSAKLSSGRASPEMDALDNLLMSQSVCPSTSCNNVYSDNDGSEGSTCKQPEEISQAKKNNEEFLKAFEGFSSIVQQLQHHSADLDLRTSRIEKEVTVSIKDISSLFETSRELKNDVEKLAKAVSIVSEETSSSHREMTHQRKENERLQKITLTTLKDAKQSYAECEQAKSNYESLIKELHSLITSIRSSLVVTDGETHFPEIKTNSYEQEKKVEYRKPVEHNNKTDDRTKTSTDAKKASKTTGYQSFFQRPTSLIYTLTNRSGSKSTSSMESKSKEIKDRESVKDQEDYINKHTNSWEKKNHKSENRNYPISMDRQSRSSKSSETSKFSDKKISSKSTKLRETSRSRDKISKLIAGRSEDLSCEDIPMMDDINEHQEGKKKTNFNIGISHVKINVSSPQKKLEKSISSPAVGTSKKTKKPNFLNIDSEDIGLRSNNSSPDSPVNNFAPFESYGPCKDFKFMPESPPFLPKHANVIKQSAMSTLPEDQIVSMRSKQGAFAITRQSSSPNLPLQRQSSATLFPIQRQHSLGTVPEDGMLPRQASLLSVPEERPIADQTLPLSPSPSLVSFPISRNSSSVDGFRSSRNSMELLTGPIIAGSQIQESFIRSLPPSLEFNYHSEAPIATSSLRRHNENKRNSKIVHI